jgi:hypothetical protein
MVLEVTGCVGGRSGIRADEVKWLYAGGGISGLGGAREVGQDAGA